MEGLKAWVSQLDFSYLIDTAVLAAACLLCITFHEMCHGLAALAMGDPTAKRAGRLTLNPLKHVDIVGLILLVVARFGWAKPVPVDARNFREPRVGMAVVALAGPVSNVVLAALAAVLYGMSLVCMYQLEALWLEQVVVFFQYVVIISAGLAVFNLLPVPPLDGSKVLALVLPPKWYWKLMRYERYGMAVLIVLLMTDVLDCPLNFLRSGLLSLMDPIAVWAANLVNAMFI